MNRITINGLYSATEWITKYAYINLLWIGFTLMGFIMFGLFPSTITMFTIIRKWIIGERDIPIFQTFWSTYKKEFRRSNGLGLMFILIGSIMVLNLFFMKQNGESIIQFIHIPLYMLIFTYIMTAFYLIPVYVHYDLRLPQVIKNSFLIMLINPLSNIMMLGSTVILYLVMQAIPGLGFFFCGSVLATIIMASSLMAFRKIDKKTKKID